MNGIIKKFLADRVLFIISVLGYMRGIFCGSVNFWRFQMLYSEPLFIATSRNILKKFYIDRLLWAVSNAL
jgi:hypothetical protein